MSEGPSYHRSLRIDARDRRIAQLGVVLVVASLGVAIAKPWATVPAPPTATDRPSGAGLAVASSSAQPPRSPVTSGAATPTVGPLPVAFSMPEPPPAAASWYELRWRKLAPDEPLNLVTSVLRGRTGYVAVGWQAGIPATAVWTSADGIHWDPLVFGTPTTFWRGLAVLGLADLRTGLAAITESLPYCGAPCPLRYVLPVVSWRSADGRRWTPTLLLPEEWMSSPTAAAPLVAVGPAGLVVATRGLSARFATSTDGSHWKVLPQGGFPPNFALNDIRGTATGYVAAGRWISSEASGEAASLWSADGRQWSPRATLLPMPPSVATTADSAVASLIPARDGLIAVGWAGSNPGAALWWQSADGRHWRSLTGYPPLGASSQTGLAGRSGPDGALVGDGGRLFAFRGGPDAAAWVSRDGLTWRQVSMRGDLPNLQATRAVLLPGGVLVTDGSVTWFGEALVR